MLTKVRSIKIFFLLHMLTKLMSEWHHDVLVITIAQLHSAKPELKLSAVSNPAHSTLVFCNDENL